MSSRLSVELGATVGSLTIDVAFETDDGPLALVGPNGSGKTSLLRLILGASPATRGKIAIGPELLFDSRSSVDVPTEDRRLGYLPQGYGLFPHMSALENVEFGLRADRTLDGPSARRDRAYALLRELEVSELAERRPGQLSGGERQRVALARALSANPRALLLDEPLAALDPGSRKRVRSFLSEYLSGLGLPTLLVTHDPRDVRALARRVAVIEAGRVIQSGTLEELRSSPASAFVEEFQSALGDT